MRVRLGLFVPSTNTAMEPEFYRMAPFDVATYTTRLYLEQIDRRNWENIIAEAEEKTRYLTSARVQLIIFGCTGASYTEGKGFNEIVERKIATKANVPCISTSTAVLRALEHLSVNKLSVVTPYPKEANDLLCKFLEENGYEVISIGSSQETVEDKQLASTGKLALETAIKYDSPESELLFISCTAWKSADIIEALESKLNKPVITSNQATLWAALRMLNYEAVRSIDGYGKLFKS